MATDIGDDLVVYVPGIGGPNGTTHLRGFVQYAICNTYDKDGIDVAFEPRSFAGYAGLRVTLADADGGKRVADVVEVDWQSSVNRLSTQSLPRRLLGGFFLLWRILRPALSIGWEARGFISTAVVGILLIVAWTYLAVAAAFAALGKLFPGMPHIPADIFGEHGVVYLAVFLVVSGLALFAGLDADTAADMADIYDRYLANRPVYGGYARLGDELVQQVRDVIKATTKHSDNEPGYRRIVLVGHSFGALPALEAAAKCSIPVEVITIGTFFAFVQKLRPERVDTMLTSVREAGPRIIRWLDFTSPKDHIAATTPFHADVEAHRPEHVALAGANRLDTINLHAHLLYFEEKRVLDAIFRPRAFDAGQPWQMDARAPIASGSA
ncbi:MAG: alpha/beta fold hydrolase [Candidatus Eremiobacteraeota bacterium]|nr:alpha/beta fold hydrolase [Candidatus Eremiobacteraeota bacterium]